MTPTETERLEAFAKCGGGDGYDFIEHERKHGWHVVPSWGRKGWDLGIWPYVSVSVCNRDGRFGVLYYVEGDVTITWHETLEERNERIDSLAFFHWRAREESWITPFDLGREPAYLRGPFSWERLEREKVSA